MYNKDIIINRAKNPDDITQSINIDCHDINLIQMFKDETNLIILNIPILKHVYYCISQKHDLQNTATEFYNILTDSIPNVTKK